MWKEGRIVSCLSYQWGVVIYKCIGQERVLRPMWLSKVRSGWCFCMARQVESPSGHTVIFTTTLPPDILLFNPPHPPPYLSVSLPPTPLPRPPRFPLPPSSLLPLNSFSSFLPGLLPSSHPPPFHSSFPFRVFREVGHPFRVIEWAGTLFRSRTFIYKPWYSDSCD